MTVKNKNFIRYLIVSLSVFAAGMVLYFCNVFTFLENKAYDNRIVLSANHKRPCDDIAVVGIDQASINSALEDFQWSWPWPRSAYGEIIDFMKAGNAKSVTFDVFFTEPSVYGQADDSVFAESCGDYGKVIQTMFVSEANAPLFPIPQIKDSAALLGNITSAKDGDGIIRRARLSYVSDGTEYPALGIAPLLIDDEDKTAFEEIRKTIPIRKDGTVLLGYKGNIDRYFPYSAYDIIKSWRQYQSGEECEYSPSDFEGLTVYFIFYAPGLYDICSTPISQLYPGAGVHITLLDNLLSNDFISEIPVWITVLICLFLSLAVSMAIFLIERSKAPHKNLRIILLFAVGLALIVSVNYTIFFTDVMVPLIAPLFCYGMTFVATIFANYTSEGKQKRFIKSAFSQYLSPFVIDKLIQDPAKLKLGGEKRNLTIFFSDIQSFTTLSENLDPNQLTELLNRYLTEMSEIILSSGGTIDKYEGDAIIAFWNAPTDIPNHAKCAVESAIACQQRLEELKEEFMKMTGRPLWTRIGLNTGDAVVGNMGSRHRFDYTMFGDAVNLASRLEGLNKQFGTYTMCSKAVKDSAVASGCNLIWRELGRVKVVGKALAVTVYEPLTEQQFNEKKSELEIFEAGLNLFYSGDFTKAIEKFRENQDRDPASLKYIARCEQLLKAPPAYEWDGVWVAEGK